MKETVFILSYLCKLPFPGQVEEKLPTIHIFHHKTQSVLGGERVFQALRIKMCIYFS